MLFYALLALPSSIFDPYFVLFSLLCYAIKAYKPLPSSLQDAIGNKKATISSGLSGFITPLLYRLGLYLSLITR
jgi:hypothetical protein